MKHQVENEELKVTVRGLRVVSPDTIELLTKEELTRYTFTEGKWKLISTVNLKQVFSPQDFSDATVNGDTDKLCNILEYLFDELEKLKEEFNGAKKSKEL